MLRSIAKRELGFFMWKVTLAPLWPPVHVGSHLTNFCYITIRQWFLPHFSKSLPRWLTFFFQGEWFPPDLSALVTGTLITTQFAFIFVAVQVIDPYKIYIPKNFKSIFEKIYTPKVSKVFLLKCYPFSLQLTAPLMSLFGPEGIFLYFAAISALNTLFVLAMVPETHGETFLHFQTRESSQKLLTVNRIWKPPEKMYFLARKNFGCVTLSKTVVQAFCILLLNDN